MAESLQDRLRGALVALAPDRPSSVDGLRPLYDRAVVFRDPIQETRGLEAFLKVNRRLLGRMRTLTWTIRSVRGDDHEVFLEWTMHGTPKLGPAISLDGVTRATATDGLIVEHRDYWDFGELVASVLPGGTRLLKVLRLPFA